MDSKQYGTWAEIVARARANMEAVDADLQAYAVTPDERPRNVLRAASTYARSAQYHLDNRAATHPDGGAPATGWADSVLQQETRAVADRIWIAVRICSVGDPSDLSADDLEILVETFGEIAARADDAAREARDMLRTRFRPRRDIEDPNEIEFCGVRWCPVCIDRGLVPPPRTESGE